MSFFNSIGHRFGRNTRSATALAPSPRKTCGSRPAVRTDRLPKPLFLCQPFVRSALVKGSFRTIVTLPKYVDVREWLALNLFEFFQHLNEFHGVVVEFCTVQSCPTMSAGPYPPYTWLSPQRKHIRLSAPQYVDYVMTYISNRLSSQRDFPTQATASFSPLPVFTAVCKEIFLHMFRIFVHIYWSHFDRIVQLSLEPHYNSLFCHFMSFNSEFRLLDRRETEPLGDLIASMEANGSIA